MDSRGALDLTFALRARGWVGSECQVHSTSHLCRHGGNIVIAIENSAIGLSRTLENKNFTTSLQGTAVGMNIDTSEIGNVSARLDQFRKKSARDCNDPSWASPKKSFLHVLHLCKDFRLEDTLLHSDSL